MSVDLRRSRETNETGKTMDPTTIRKATQRDIQRQMFIGSLHKAMDRMEARRAGLLKQAKSFLDSGCTEDEVSDLLTLEGVPPADARSEVAAAKAQPKQAAGGDRWDFLWEDAYGRLWRGSEFGQTVTASTKEEAMKKAEAIVVRSSDSMEVVINVEPVR